MDIESLRNYCISKPHVTESFPFDEHTLVFKVHGKMFALIGLEWEDPAINLKCDPALAEELRETYPQVIPGYHSNKKHWNTVYFSTLEDPLITSWVDHSYNLVWQGLPKKLREGNTF